MLIHTWKLSFSHHGSYGFVRDDETISRQCFISMFPDVLRGYRIGILEKNLVNLYSQH